MNASPSDCGRMIKARVFADAAHLARELARTMQALLAAEPPAGSPSAALMLAGGRTPLAAYEQIARDTPAAHKGWRMLYSDERLVPPEDPRSNYGATRPMLDRLALPEERVMRVHGEAAADEAAARYGRELDDFLSAGGRIALGLLGLGADGHTASLFTPAHLAAARERWAVAVQRPDGLGGVSVTPGLLRRVDRLAFIVTGGEKRAIARQFLTATRTTIAGQAVAGHPCVEAWFDPAAWPLG